MPEENIAPDYLLNIQWLDGLSIGHIEKNRLSKFKAPAWQIVIVELSQRHGST